MAGFNFGDAVGTIGHALNLPEFGISEALGGKNNAAQAAAGNIIRNGVVNDNRSSQQAPVANQSSPQYSGPVATSTGGGGGYSTARAAAPDLSSFDTTISQLNSLLGRTNTALQQGLTNNQDEYNRQVGSANADKEKQLSNYEDQRVSQNQQKLSNFDTINRNANNGYRSLAGIIGRAAGTGSSSFQELLPDVVGKDTSSKRQDVTETYGRNLQGIDKAQNQYLLDFQGVLDDLLRQNKANESQIRTGIENQKQGILSQLAQASAARASAAGGNPTASAAPYQAQIENSRNAVESFFNQFRTPYTAKQAVAAAPELAGYTVDRSQINAQNAGLPDASNPYAELLRKRVEEQA